VTRQRIQERRIPLTVIGGYLGAGKTTLLNRLLHNTEGRRLAVMVNDFGAIDIDSELVQRREGDTISLTNGCICCGLGGEFMFELAGLRDRDDPPEHVIVEASGIGDAANILAYGDSPGFIRDAAIVVADAETVRRRGEDAATRAQILGQLRAADLLVLSKTDLVEPGELARTRAWVREIAGPSTAIVDGSFGDVPAEFLLGAGPGKGDRHRHDAGHEHEHEHGHDAHPGYEAWSWAGAAPLHGHGFVDALKALPEGVVRGKGFVHLREDPDNRYLLQLVGRRFSIEVDRAWRGDAPGSRLVLIGLPGSIDPAQLDAVLDRLTAAPADEPHVAG
jgi:G3E family GTPase